MWNNRCIWHSLFIALLMLLMTPLNGQSDGLKDTLVVGFDENYPPLQYINSQGEPDGFDIDLIKLVAKKAGFKFVFKYGPWFEIQKKLISGEVDIVPGMYINRGRNDDVLFSLPTLITAHEFYVRSDSPLNSLNDVRTHHGIRIIIQNVKVLKEYLLSISSEAELIYVESPLEGFQKLSLGYGDCLFMPDIVAENYFKTFPADNIQKTGIKVLYREYAIATNIKLVGINEKINLALDELSNDESYSSIQKKWFLQADTKVSRRSYLILLIFVAFLIMVLTASVLWTWSLRVSVRKKTILLNQELIDKSETERLLKVEKQKAEEADRLKSSFLANMSHEIRTPMNAIIGFGELLIDKDLSIEDREKYVSHINGNGQILLNLINDIIDVSKIEAGLLNMTEAPFKLLRVLKEIEVVVDQQIEKKHKGAVVFVTDFSDQDSIWITSDEVRFKQIFYNLLSNANKFTFSGEILFGYQKISSEIVRFYVKDTGIGIPKNKQEIVFSRFRQIDEGTNRAYEGSGLGLFITKTLVELLGGSIILISEPDIGSEFVVDLPIAGCRKNLA
ncbi:MAG: transporter substrate-binding domain-containing protein [Bacteroidales bacterium]|nr:transporter substrate-binding domain-containing protein [Bacteroidales bacterium]